ncbi:MAG: ABC transporter substrate-binding protein [Actinomycetota bacterium]
MTRIVSCVVTPLILTLFLAACAQQAELEGPPPSPQDPALPITVTDDEGIEATLDAEPDRIVTFAPSHTEIVFALGLGDRLVGVSGEFDDHPPEAREIEQVGGAGGVEPNIEKVVSLEPDVLLTAFIGGEWKERLRELGVPVFTTLASSFEDTLADIETIGRVLGEEDTAAALTADMRAEADAAQVEDEPVSCFLDLSDLFTVGPGSLEFDLLERAGCDPVTGSVDEAYPQWSLERLVEDDPDVYLVSEGIPLEEIVRQPGIRDLSAVRAGRVFEVDSDVISRPGPRVAQGIAELSEALHGEPAEAA